MKNPSRFLLTVAGIGFVFLPGCGPDSPPGGSGSAEKERVFQVRGVVQELPADDPSEVIIDHEEMPGYMDAMIMPFRAKDPAELKGLAPGAVVTFDYHVRELESWIENVSATGETGEVKSAETENDSATPLLSVGESLPDYAFTDENGEAVKLSELRGMAVALTFVFSRCPVPEYCPRMMRNFDEVRTRLENDPEAPEDYRLLTISFDTENDTPEIMKKWGAGYGHQSGRNWSLLTADSSGTINAIGGNVGLKFGEANGSYQHNLRTVVLNPDGTIRRIFNDETWSTDELITEIKAAQALRQNGTR